MRLARTLVAGGALSSLVACGSGQGPDALGGGSAVTGAGPGAAAAGGSTPTPGQTECAAVAAPTALSNLEDVRNVQLVGSVVFFQSGTTIYRVGKDGTGLATVFTSPNLVRGYVDGNALLTIESTDDADPNATLRVITATTPIGPANPFPDFGQPSADPAADPAGAIADPNVRVDPNAAGGDARALGGTTAAADVNAAGIDVFASDDAFFYLLEDGADDDTLLQMPKSTAQPQPVVALPNVLSHPQLHGTDLWFVQDAQDVFKVTIDDGNPKQMFGLGTELCSLTVDATSAYCSGGTSVERRDLTGGNPTTLVDAKSSKTSAPFGSLVTRDSTLYVPSAGPDPVLKNVIVALSSATPVTQKLVACGRGLVTSMSVDATSVAWAEESGGVFLAPR